MMTALAIVTNLSPAISFAAATPSSTLPVKVVRGNRSAASSGGGRWVTTTTGAPAGWLSPQPSVRSNNRRPATSAPQPEVSSRSIGALAASTEKLMSACARGTATSPAQYQATSSAGLSSGCATNPSSDMHMWVSTLVISEYDSAGAPDSSRDGCRAWGKSLGRPSANMEASPRVPRETHPESLHGGAISRGIVRDGSAVFRPAGAWTAAVHDHLRGVRAAGVVVPEPIGVDDDHEVLTYIEGTPLWSPGERTYLDLDAVSDMGRLLRSYHDIASTLGADERGSWNRLPIEAPSPHHIICHNDFAPWNVLRTPTGLAIIDWDLAAPGSALWDLAYAAWAVVPFWNDDDVAARGLDPIRDRAERLAALLDAYRADAEQRARLIPTVRVRLDAAIDQSERWAAEGRPGWRDQWSLPEPYRHGGGFKRDLAFLDAW